MRDFPKIIHEEGPGFWGFIHSESKHFSYYIKHHISMIIFLTFKLGAGGMWGQAYFSMAIASKRQAIVLAPPFK